MTTMVSLPGAGVWMGAGASLAAAGGQPGTSDARLAASVLVALLALGAVALAMRTVRPRTPAGQHRAGKSAAGALPAPAVELCGVVGSHGFGPCVRHVGHGGPWHEQADGKRYDVLAGVGVEPASWSAPAGWRAPDPLGAETQQGDDR